MLKGGRCEADDDDDDVPGELPDIDDQYVPLIPEAKIQNTKPMKGSSIKANKKPKEKSKPSIPKEKLSTKPKEQKKPKDTKMSTKVEGNHTFFLSKTKNFFLVKINFYESTVCK